MKKFSVSLWLTAALLSLSVEAAIDTYPFSNDENRHRFQTLTAELRCPKCQNQNIADSNAEIAKDLRTKVFQMLEKGQSDQEIVQYMTDRYGDFVLYEPKFNARTLLLWGAPVVLLVCGLAVVFWLGRGRRAEAAQTVEALDAERQRRLDKILADHKDGEQ
ncbi:MAG: cytochrome c-type biogenesis protein [Gammaproteobacteria bacterium]